MKKYIHILHARDYLELTSTEIIRIMDLLAGLVLGLCVAVWLAYYRQELLAYPYLQALLYLPNGQGG
jgi:hypothetical protein